MSKKDITKGLLISLVLMLFAVQFASSSPDGLEWSAEVLGFIKRSAPSFFNIMPDYQITAVPSKFVSSAMAGITGVLAVFLVTMVTGKILAKSK